MTEREFKEKMRFMKSHPEAERMQNTIAYNSGVREAWTPIWVRNLCRTYSEVERLYKDKDRDIKNLPRVKGDPILLLGSGPSLDDAIPYLKEWNGAIACSTSQLGLLEYLGIHPTYCMLIDCDPAAGVLNYVLPYTDFHKDTILITHPQIPREYLQAWKGDVYFFRMLDPGDEFSAKYLPFAVGWMNQETNWKVSSYVLNSGNVINSLIPLLQLLGYGGPGPNDGAIFLLGYDLGYPDNKMRSSRMDKQEDGTWKVTEPPPLTDERWKQAVRSDGMNGVPSDELGVFYKYSFMNLYGMACPPILSCSRGILYEVPYVHPKEVIEKQGRGFSHMLIPPVQAYKLAREYMWRRGIHMLKTDFFLEVQNTGAWKGFQKIRYCWRHHWLGTRHWKWQGYEKGYVPLSWKLKRMKNAKGKVIAPDGQVVAQEGLK